MIEFNPKNFNRGSSLNLRDYINNNPEAKAQYDLDQKGMDQYREWQNSRNDAYSNWAKQQAEGYNPSDFYNQNPQYRFAPEELKKYQPQLVPMSQSGIASQLGSVMPKQMPIANPSMGGMGGMMGGAMKPVNPMPSMGAGLGAVMKPVNNQNVQPVVPRFQQIRQTMSRGKK